MSCIHKCISKDCLNPASHIEKYCGKHYKKYSKLTTTDDTKTIFEIVGLASLIQSFMTHSESRLTFSLNKKLLMRRKEYVAEECARIVQNAYELYKPVFKFAMNLKTIISKDMSFDSSKYYVNYGEKLDRIIRENASIINEFSRQNQDDNYVWEIIDLCAKDLKLKINVRNILIILPTTLSRKTHIKICNILLPAYSEKSIRKMYNKKTYEAKTFDYVIRIGTNHQIYITNKYDKLMSENTNLYFIGNLNNNSCPIAKKPIKSINILFIPSNFWSRHIFNVGTTKTIRFSNELTKTNDQFLYLSHIDYFSLPPSIKQLRDNFCYFSRVKKIDLSACILLDNIPSYFCTGCFYLETLILPETIERIQDNFCVRTAIEIFTIPKATYIVTDDFMRESKLKTLILSLKNVLGSVIRLSKNFCQDCPLEHIIIDDEMPSYLDFSVILKRDIKITIIKDEY